MVGRIALERQPHRLAHLAARTIAAHHIAGANGFYLAFVDAALPTSLPINQPLKLRHHWVWIAGIAWRTILPLKLGQVAAIVRHKACGRLLHFFKVKVMHPRLVKNHMRHVRQAFFYIRHTAAAHNAAFVAALGIVGLPKASFVHPIRFFQNLVCKAKGFKHFHGAASHAIGLAQLQRPRFLLYHHRAYAGKYRQLRRQRQARRATANDQHIGLAWQASLWCLRHSRCV